MSKSSEELNSATRISFVVWLDSSRSKEILTAASQKWDGKQKAKKDSPFFGKHGSRREYAALEFLIKEVLAESPLLRDLDIHCGSLDELRERDELE